MNGLDKENKGLEKGKQLARELAAILEQNFILLRQRDLDKTIRKAIADGLLKEDPGYKECPNCHCLFSGNYCGRCNQDPQESELLDRDSETEENRAELGGSDDDASDEQATRDDLDLFPPIIEQASLTDRLREILKDYDLTKEEISIVSDFISTVLERDIVQHLGKQSFEKVLARAINATGQRFRKSEGEISDVLDKVRGVLPEIFHDLFLAQSQEMDKPTDQDEPVLEIRRVNEGFQVIVNDRFENLIATGKKGSIDIGIGTPVTARKFLELKKRKLERLEEIGGILIEKRKAFFGANSAKEARKVKRIPLTQTEIADVLDVHKATVTRYFRGTVKTPHGVYPFSEFVARPTAKKEGVSTYRIRERIKEILKANENLTHEKIRDILEEEDGIPLTREMVSTYIRELSPEPKRAKNSLTASQKAVQTDRDRPIHPRSLSNKKPIKGKKTQKPKSA